MNIRLTVQSILYTLLLPGIVAGVIPWFFIVSAGTNPFNQPFSWIVFLAFLLGLLGSAGLIYCIWEFAAIGKGTLAPIHPPSTLVVRGAYRYTRNPMYLAVCVVLVAETVLINNSSMLIYTVAVALGFHCFVCFYEEPVLRKRFGEEYKAYCSKVSRWWLAFPLFK
jgi:protein-S-isoprenylcysteine O-methyltransferase Ste14